MIHSMTGYAVASAETPRGTLSLELRSVNSRFLDLQFRVADELRALEAALREMTFTATLPELRDRIRARRDGGADQFAVFLAPRHESALEDWARVVETGERRPAVTRSVS